MLDDLKFIHQRDGSDALGIAERQAAQLRHQFESPSLNGQINNVVYAGMGGSSLAALVTKSWPGVSVPYEVCREYAIPGYVNERTLFLAASYSGNTEETLSALAAAEAKNAQIIILASGGQLAEIAKTKNYHLMLIPKAEEPRYGVLSMLKAITVALEAAGLVSDKSAELEQGADFLTGTVKDWVATVPTDKNPAKQLAEELVGKSIVIYAGPKLGPVAYKWKINFNENAKNVAWWNELPEFDHNELIGWSSHPIQKPYAVVELRSKLEHPRIQKRFEVGERILSGRRPAPHVIEVQGQNLLEQVLWAIAYGDFVTIYAGLLNNVDPAPVELVEKFKKELG